MYCLHILLKKAALSLDDGLHPASEGHAGLGHHGLVHEGKVLLNGGDQGALGSVGTSNVKPTFFKDRLLSFSH
jgi:hypothetical protein